MTSSSFSRSSNIRSTAMNPIGPLQEKSSKEFRSTNTWLETKKLQNIMDESKALLEEERVEKLGQLSRAEWIATSHVAKVTRNVGRQWMTMGHQYLGDLVLYPEEALFLLETNTIEIYYGGLPMSLQQAYSVLLGVGTGCTLEEYRTYAHLTRYGYRLRRHKPEQNMPGDMRHPEENQPLEVDIVGIIRKRKSSDVTRSEKVVEVEDSVEIVKYERRDCPPKQFSAVEESYPSTSGMNSKKADFSSEDDDIKFIEIVDANKKRKVADTVIINDDVEITLSYNTKSESANQISPLLNNENEELCRPECTDNYVKQETAKISSDSYNTSASDMEFGNNSSNLPVNKPSRGMYDNRPLASITDDTELPESKSRVGGPSKAIENSIGEVKASLKDKKISSETKSKTINDDVIVLSDDETKEDSKQAKELLKFYKEISLIELIDISEEDEGEKTASRATINGKDRTVDDSYDFWGVLGRIPTLENGRLSVQIPAPPPGLIPPNIRPVQDEYTIDLMTIVERQSKDVSGNARPAQERHRQSHEDTNEHFSRQQQIQPLEDLHRQIPRSVTPVPWNQWNCRNNRYQHTSNMGNGYQFNAFQDSQYQINSGRLPWFSFIYPQRQQNNCSPATQFQAWIPPVFSQNYQNAQQTNYPYHQIQRNANQSWEGNRQQQRHNYSSSMNGQGNGALWQQACMQRRGNGHSRRGNMNAFNRRRYWNKTSRVMANEGGNKYSSVVPKKPDACNWSEIKTNGDNPKSTELPDGLQSENKKDILPLLKPADSISTDAVQSKLQVTNSAKFSCYNASDKNTSSLSIKFDLYMPNSNFRKSCPGLPKYRLSIVRSEDKIPQLKDTLYLMKDLNDEVPLLFAVNFPDNINFFSFSNVDLPVQISK